VVSERVFLPACTLHIPLMIPGDAIHITYRRRRYSRAENIFQSESEGEEDTGGINEHQNDSAIHILNDLAKTQNDIVRVQGNLERGQQQMVDLLAQLVAKTQGNQNIVVNDGLRETNGSLGHNGNRAEGSHTHVPTQNHIGSTSRATPRPHMPQFLDGHQAVNQGKQEQLEDFVEYLREYQTLGESIRL